MKTESFAPLLHTIFREIVHGSPDPVARTYMLNRGDAGLLSSLDRLPAAAASATHDGGASIAAHVDHLRYGMSLLNQWARGALPPGQETDWTASWRKNRVSDAEWQALRDQLRKSLTVQRVVGREVNSKVDLSDDALRIIYEREKDTWKIPEKAHLAEILIANGDSASSRERAAVRAKEASTLLKGGAKFESESA